MAVNECVVYDSVVSRAGSRAREIRSFSSMCDARIQLAGYKQTSRRIACRTDLESYCRELLCAEALESFHIICVDAQCHLIGESEISSGSLSEVSAYPRKIATVALLMNAHSVFLAHNHPGGTCAPSPEDISSTIQLQRLLNGVGILVLDHIIVAGDRTYSMIQHGDIDYRIKGR